MYDHHKMPVIRLEVEGMRYTVLQAMQGHNDMVNEELQKAVDDYCQPRNIEAIIREAAQQEIDKAIQEAIADFYRYGAGQEVIRQVVNSKLEKRIADET